MDKGKLVNLVKETEKGLFRANKDLAEANRLSAKIARLFKNLALAEAAAQRTPALAKELKEQIKASRIVGQGNELFKGLEILRKGLEELSAREERARAFVESYRTERLYSFENSRASSKFARQALELFSVKEAFFRPRFIGTIDLSDLAARLNAGKQSGGLVLQPRDIKALVALLSEKRLASQISLETNGLKLAWQDKKTISVDASAEKLYRLDRLCDVMQGKCLEK